MDSLFEDIRLFDDVENKNNIIITGAGKAYKAAYALDKLRRTDDAVLFVCENDYEAKKYHSLFKKSLPDEKLYLFAKKPLYFTYADSISRGADDERIRTIAALYKKGSKLVVTSIWALSETMPFFSEDDITSMSVGDETDMERLISRLVEIGYRREERTEAAGQFSVRGGILDFFPAGVKNPYRVEFFGNEIDSIRIYNPESQLSLKNSDKFELVPYADVLLGKDEYEKAMRRFRSFVEKTLTKLDDEECRESAYSLVEKLCSDPVQAASYIYAYSDISGRSLLDMARNRFVVLCEPSSLKKGYDDAKRMVNENYSMLSEKALAYPAQVKAFADYKSIIDKINGSSFAALCAVSQSAPLINAKESVNAGCADFEGFGGNVNYLLKAFAEYAKSEYKIIITYPSEDTKKSLTAFFESLSMPLGGDIKLVKSNFSLGIDIARARRLVIPASFIITDKKLRKTNPPAKKKAEAFFTDIKPGDYVVHDYHGIGRYEGVIQIKSEGIIKDYIKISYANEDTLYVPPEQMDLIQKYFGTSDADPRMSRLGGNEWQTAKKRVSNRLKELAAEYVKMYAKRRLVKGFAFSPDTSWQAEFEENFPYEPTPDQLNASEEIKRDMEKDVPMDRLLCADVGYGKTEVAARAAFKAVNDSKQTAVLVPTTILAAQHYNSFAERFKGYPIRIEMLSRFVSNQKIKKIKQDIGSGLVDIVIGTQKILAADITYKDLGLLIVDEEQRFGVAQKDKLKLIKENVDTLSLSATPIPRTLHMSLSGIRDMSVIQTPPPNRSPVQTFVMQYDDVIVKEAIQNELVRGGQVFYIHNRTHSIENCCERVRSLVPDARVAYAHGQMKESELEDVILRFLGKEFDVLVCTTIIENGIDIVSANTIIIEDADNLGLSQLYQLRGRVGRSDVSAYAYMMYRRDKTLSEVSSKRLQAIKQFTKFGSGFKIALRDLQIRGSGNILGAQQHGNFGNIGYEMYCRLLSEAIDEQKGVYKPQARESEIDIDISAYIPSNYIQSEEERIDAYKRIASVESAELVTEVTGDLTDMYSDPPLSVINLINTAYIKSLAEKAGVKKLRSRAKTVSFEFFPEIAFDGEFITRLSSDYDFKIKTGKNSRSMFFRMRQEADVLKFITDLTQLLIENKSVL